MEYIIILIKRHKVRKLANLLRKKRIEKLSFCGEEIKYKRKKIFKSNKLKKELSKEELKFIKYQYVSLYNNISQTSLIRIYNKLYLTCERLSSLTEALSLSLIASILFMLVMDSNLGNHISISISKAYSYALDYFSLISSFIDFIGFFYRVILSILLISKVLLPTYFVVYIPIKILIITTRRNFSYFLSKYEMKIVLDILEEKYGFIA